jgi:hypothetical protein
MRLKALPDKIFMASSSINMPRRKIPRPANNLQNSNDPVILSFHFAFILTQNIRRPSFSLLIKISTSSLKVRAGYFTMTGILIST